MVLLMMSFQINKARLQTSDPIPLTDTFVFFWFSVFWRKRKKKMLMSAS